MHMLGTAATTVWAFDSSLGFLGAAVDGLRAQGRLGLLAQALVSQSWAALHCAKAPLAVSAADEAARLARETGQARWAVAADLVRATVAGERGDFDTADAIASAAEAELLPIGAQAMLALVQFARGRGAVAHQDYSDGFDHLRRTLDPGDVAYHPFVGSWALADLVEAAVNVGEPHAAEAYLARLESLAASTSGPFLLAALGYARPLARLGRRGRGALPRSPGQRPRHLAVLPRPPAAGLRSLAAPPAPGGGVPRPAARGARELRRAGLRRPGRERARGAARLRRDQPRPGARPARPADAAGAADRPADRRRPVQPRDRPAALSLAPDGRLPPVPDLPEARDRLPGTGRSSPGGHVRREMVTASPMGSQRKLERTSSGACASSRSIASRPSWKCFHPS